MKKLGLLFSIVVLAIFAGSFVSAADITLVDGREYPYNSASTTTADDYYRVSIVTSGNYLKSITIANNEAYWTRSSSPLYPAIAGQSLTGKTGTAISFSDINAPSGTPGKAFAKIRFDGFDFNKLMTTVEIGKAVTTGLAAEANHGGIKFTGKDRSIRVVPFYYVKAMTGIDGRDQNTTFTAYSGTTPKTIYITLNKGDSKLTSRRGDYNFTFSGTDYINGRQWTLNSCTTASCSILVTTTTKTLSLNGTMDIDGVKFKLVQIISTSPAKVKFAVDGYISLSQTNYVGQGGSSIYNTLSTNFNGKLFFTEGATFYSPTNPGKIDFDVDNNRNVYYGVRVTNDNVYFLLGAQQLGQGENGLIQSNKKVFFDGTTIPADDNSNYLEDPKVDYLYYVPKVGDYNKAAGRTTAAGVFTNSKAYFTALFRVYDNLQNVPININIDTADGGLSGPFPNNNNMAWPDFDANYNNYDKGKPAFILKSGTGSGQYSKSYTDSGTRIDLTSNDTAKVVSPDTNAYIQLVVYSDSNTGIPSDSQKLYRVLLDSPLFYEINAQTLTKAGLPYLKDETQAIKVDNNQTQVNEMEKIFVNADASMYTAGTPFDLITTIGPDSFKYTIQLNNTSGINLGLTTFTDTGADDSIPIYLFGKKYYLKSANLSGTKKIVLSTDDNSGTACTDSDGGSLPFKKGTAVGQYYNDLNSIGPKPYADRCTSCDANYLNCKKVLEYYCGNGKVYSNEYPCELGCKEEACISDCNDSDGNNSYVYGYTTETFQGSKIKNYDKCVGSLLYEAICSPGTTRAVKPINCTKGCSLGVCLS